MNLASHEDHEPPADWCTSNCDTKLDLFYQGLSVTEHLLGQHWGDAVAIYVCCADATTIPKSLVLGTDLTWSNCGKIGSLTNIGVCECVFVCVCVCVCVDVVRSNAD